MHQPVEQGDVGAGFVLQMQGGEIGQVDAARVGNDQHCAALAHRLADAHAEDGVLLGGVGADHEEGFRLVGDIVHGVGHGARAEGGGQTGHRAGVSETGAVVDVVRPYHLPGEFVHQIVFFVQALRRGQHADASAPWYRGFRAACGR